MSDWLVRPEKLYETDRSFPLEVAFCESCKVVHVLEELPENVLFPEDYPYFSSFSDHLLAHSRKHALGLIESRKLDGDSFVVELASNDGYLLRNFVEAGVPVLGIDPAPAQVKAANVNGVHSICRFFGKQVAVELVANDQRADVIIANNVFAHVPDINGFAAGMKTLLAPGGLITIENPYVRDLIDNCEFDTIYHEHLYYHSCSSIGGIVARAGLHLNHVEYFPELHGGTLRWHISHEPGRSPELEKYFAAEAAQVSTPSSSTRGSQSE